MALKETPQQLQLETRIGNLEVKMAGLNNDIETTLQLIKELQMYLLRLGKNQEMIALQLAQWPYIQVPDLKTKSKPPKSSDEEKDKENKKRGN